MQDLVQHLNQNTARLYAWRATNARIRIEGPGMLPIPGMSAMLAVEAPRNLRIIVSNVAGNEADFGSNEEQFWFWVKRGEQNAIFTARHDQMDRAQRRFPLPIQPDWLIEVLGVIPIDPNDVRMEPIAEEPVIVPPRRRWWQGRQGQPNSTPVGNRRARLISQRLSPQGEPMRKETIVDLCHGNVLEHALYDARGHLVARALMSGHFADATSGAVLANNIHLEWPRERQTLSLTLGPVQVNPSQFPSQTWSLPEIPNVPVVDLGQ